MLHSYNDLLRFAIRTEDGRKGHVEDIYFDDDSWSIRYLVAHTGFLFTARQVLIGADLIEAPDMAAVEWPVAMRSAEIEEAAPPEQDAPVSRQQARDKEKILDAFLWPTFLVGPHNTGYTPLSAEEQVKLSRQEVEPESAMEKYSRGREDDPHLRSMDEIRRYSVETGGEKVGSVSDFLVDPEQWKLRYLVIDTGKWLSGRHVVLTIDHVSSIEVEERAVHVDVDSATIEAAPPVESLDDLQGSSVQEALDRLGPIGYWPVAI